MRPMQGILAIAIFVTALLAAGRGIETAVAAPIDVVIQLERQMNELLDSARYPEAEQVALEMIDYARREAANLNPDIQPAVRSNLAGVYAGWGQYQNAERLSLEVIAMIEQQHGRDYYLLEQPLTNLAISYRHQERFAEAATAQRRALTIRQRQYGANSPEAAMAMENLAVTLDNWGYRDQAEPLYQRAMAINMQKYGAQHPTVARNAANLGLMYTRENRPAEAEDYLKYVLGLPADKVYRGDLVDVLYGLGTICQSTDRFSEAEGHYRKAMELKAQIYGADHPLAILRSGLGNLYLLQQRLPEAEEIDRKELAASAEFYGEESAEYAMRLYWLAQACHAQGRSKESMELMDRELRILDKVQPRASLLCDSHWLRGLIGWELGQYEKAEADFTEAMRMTDEMRTHSVGAERERAQSFSQLQNTYTDPGVLYLAAGKIGAGFNCLERGRARSLVDQLITAHVDLLEGVPASEAQRLRQAEAQAKADVASLERQIEVLPARGDLDDAARQRELDRLRNELGQARHRAVEAYAAIRTASPKFRELVGQGFKPIELPALESWLREHRAMMLYYVNKLDESWVIAIGGDGDARASRLEVSEEQAKSLGIKAGPLNPQVFETVLANAEGNGVLQLISNPESGDQATSRLAALWQVLVPEVDRKQILGGEVKRLIIVPDGSLALLPFEALVVKEEPMPEYLIDAGPAIDYGPSASIFSYLAQRPAAASRSDREPVLTLGDPAYGAGSQPATAADRQGGNSLQARYSRLGGQLSRLPYSGREASWVADVFTKNGVKAAILKDRLATERMVRGNIAGRKIVHLACHGLCDQTYGNFFGALALAPGGGQQVDPSDDGLLSLSEMYELDLTSCELAILSACQTNYGEHQEGEGVWALTRGFIVAGSRRVVASNWLVDDEAAASIVSYYCSLLAKAAQEGRTPDYAEALREAKRWARQQEKWKSPYYWATFVLIGPN